MDKLGDPHSPPIHWSYYFLHPREAPDHRNLRTFVTLALSILSFGSIPFAIYLLSLRHSRKMTHETAPLPKGVKKVHDIAQNTSGSPLQTTANQSVKIDDFSALLSKAIAERNDEDIKNLYKPFIEHTNASALIEFMFKIFENKKSSDQDIESLYKRHFSNFEMDLADKIADSRDLDIALILQKFIAMGGDGMSGLMLRECVQHAKAEQYFLIGKIYSLMGQDKKEHHSYSHYEDALIYYAKVNPPTLSSQIWAACAYHALGEETKAQEIVKTITLQHKNLHVLQEPGLNSKIESWFMGAYAAHLKH